MISRLMLNLRDPMLLKPVVLRAPAPTSTEGSTTVLRSPHAYPPGAGTISTLAVTMEDVGFEDTYVYTDEQEMAVFPHSSLGTQEPNNDTGRGHSNDTSRCMFSLDFALLLMG
jgi:hypothetical protein